MKERRLKVDRPQTAADAFKAQKPVNREHQASVSIRVLNNNNNDDDDDDDSDQCI